MRVLVCGDRDWSDEEKIHRILSRFDPNTVIIHGACSGADTIADNIARTIGLNVIPFPADWDLGHKAGPIRNARMLSEGKPDLVIAFHDSIDTSKGTKNMVAQATKAGVKTVVYMSDTQIRPGGLYRSENPPVFAWTNVKVLDVKLGFNVNLHDAQPHIIRHDEVFMFIGAIDHLWGKFLSRVGEVFVELKDVERVL